MPCSRKKFPGAHSVLVYDGKATSTMWVTEPRDASAEAKVIEETRALGDQYRLIQKNDELTQEEKRQAWKEYRKNIRNGTVVLPTSRQSLEKPANPHDTESEEDVEMEYATDSGSSSESDTDMAGEDANTEAEEALLALAGYDSDMDREDETDLESSVNTPSSPRHFTFSAPQIKQEKQNELSLTRTSQNGRGAVRRARQMTHVPNMPKQLRQRTNVAVQAREAEIATLKAQNKLLWELVDTVQEHKAMLRGKVEALGWTIVRGGGTQKSIESEELAEKEKGLIQKLGRD